MIETLDLQEQIQEKWMIFWWALGIGWLALGIAWRQGLFKPFKISYLPYISGRDVLKGFGLFLFTAAFLIPFLMTLILSFRVNLTLTPHLKGWFNLLSSLGGFGAVSLIYWQLTPLQRKQFWNRSDASWFHDYLIGVSLWFVAFPLVLAFSQLISLFTWYLFHHPFIEQNVVTYLRQSLDDPLLFGLTVVMIVTLIPFTEEFLFRGLLQSWLKNKSHHAPFSIALTSLVFALFHFSTVHGLSNIELLSSLFLLSCVLGFIYERQRSLWASIGLHSFFNLMSIIMIFKEK